MKPIPAILAGALAAASPLVAEPLSESERLTLIDRLENLRGKAQSETESHFDNAAQVFRKAVGSNDAAVELYVKCVEKVEFEARDRDRSAFLDWRGDRRDRFGDEGFALALRQQLRWTLLTMRAAASPDDKDKLAGEVMAILESIYSNPEALAGYTDILGTPVTRTVFARAYELDSYEIPGWPLAPLRQQGGRVRVEEPFEQVIFPVYREEEEIKKLRSAWNRRIHFEEVAHGFWSGEDDEDREPGSSEARDEFLKDGKPQLVWEREIDLFEAGDQKNAAMNMLEHLEEHISHSSARRWEQEFREVITPDEEEPG